VGTLKWDAATVAEAIGGTLIGGPVPVISAVSTDSRTVPSGALFVAIAGESFDGHDYAGAAVAAGAAAAVVARTAASAAEPRIEVGDTATALRDLAALRRDELAMPVVAVTGSTGKTSTKDLLAAALPGAYASPRSFNNEVGVPLTVLGVPDAAAHLVVEVGSRGAGHITWLMPAVRPDVAIVTNLGVVHLETFGTTDILADAKFELVYALTSTGTAVLPWDEPRLARSHAGRTITFGIGGGDVRAEDIELDAAARPTFTLRTGEESVRVRLPLSGRHQALNAAAAAAAGIGLGLPLHDLGGRMESATGSAWRMELHHGRFTVVNDAYNANPDSMEAALRTVAEMPGRHVAVLGKMAELGPVEAEEHLRIGELTRSLGFAHVIVVGDDAGMADGAGSIARLVPDADAAFELAARLLEPGDTVLVKASRAVGLEAVAQRLAAEAVA
jgi:UDP-N-acetylmuramoyl-tripeptide--D-alanyl-D-alanine ligase